MKRRRRPLENVESFFKNLKKCSMPVPVLTPEKRFPPRKTERNFTYHMYNLRHVA